MDFKNIFFVSAIAILTVITYAYWREMRRHRQRLERARRSQEVLMRWKDSVLFDNIAERARRQ
jgi:hypothetical protein